MDSETRPILSEEDITYVHRYLVKHWLNKGRWHDADDLAQDGVLQCVAKAGEYKARKGYGSRVAALRTFLVAVGINKGKDRLKSEERQERKKQRLSEILQIHRTNLRSHVSSRKPSLD